MAAPVSVYGYTSVHLLQSSINDYAKSGSELNCFVHTADCCNIQLFNRLMMAEAVLLQCSVNGCTHYKLVYIAVFLCGCYRAV